MEFDDVKLEIFCDIFNDIIYEAISHGGDYGGPYYTNKENLENKIDWFLKWTGLNKDLTIYKIDVPKLLIKNKINNKEEL